MLKAFLHSRKSDNQPRLITRTFVILFCLVLLSNSYLAVYYCFEQWLEHLHVSPNWRGLLLGSLFAMVMFARPVVSVLFLKANKFPAVVLAVLVSSMIMFSYQYLPVDSPYFVWLVLLLRIIQGIFLAIFSSCVVSVMVRGFPKGQSARGFALFSLTMLLPYATIPAVGELLLPLLGSEPHLYAMTALLGIPALLMTLPIRAELSKPDIEEPSTQATADETAIPTSGVQGVLYSVRHSGLALIFLAILFFGLTTNTGIFFIKGLCSLTHQDPATFFTAYTGTIMVVRVLFSSRLDALPRIRVVPLCILALALAVFSIAWGPAWSYIPASILYGAAISMIYPLLACEVFERSEPHARTINSNIIMMMFDAAATCSPLIGGAVIHLGFDYHGVISTAGILTLTSGLCFIADHLRLRAQNR